MTSTRNDAVSPDSLFRIVRSIPGAAREVWRGKQAAWKASALLRHPSRDLAWEAEMAETLKGEIERLLPGTETASARHAKSAPLCEEDCIILEEIKTLTVENNRSNITRTAAYLSCYDQYPELHWALLAHMVSRNGGYHMTDRRATLCIICKTRRIGNICIGCLSAVTHSFSRMPILNYCST